MIIELALLLMAPVAVKGINEVLERHGVPAADIQRGRKAKKKRRRNHVLREGMVPVVITKAEVKKLNDPKTTMDEKGEILARAYARRQAIPPTPARKAA